MVGIEKLHSAHLSGSMMPMSNEEKIMDEGQEELKIYELGYLLAPTIPEEYVGGEGVKVKDVLEKIGFIMGSDEPVMKQLAYEMSAVIGGKKYRFHTAYFGSIIFQTNSASVKDIKTALAKNENITRHIVLSRTKESLLPSKRRISMTPKTADEKVSSKKSSLVREENVIDEAALDKTIEEMVAE